MMMHKFTFTHFSRFTYFLPRDPMRKRGLCCRPVSARPSVCSGGSRISWWGMSSPSLLPSTFPFPFPSFPFPPPVLPLMVLHSPFLTLPSFSPFPTTFFLFPSLSFPSLPFPPLKFGEGFWGALNFPSDPAANAFLRYFETRKRNRWH